VHALQLVLGLWTLLQDAMGATQQFIKPFPDCSQLPVDPAGVLTTAIRMYYKSRRRVILSVCPFSTISTIPFDPLPTVPVPCPLSRHFTISLPINIIS